MRWLAEGESDPSSQYHQLYLDIEQADAEWEAEMISKVRDAAASGKPNTWQAAMTLLERRMPERYGRNDRVTVGGGEKPITVATHHILHDPEQQALVLDRLGELASRRPAKLPAPEVADADEDDDGVYRSRDR
jgi:hypothetical protein